MTDTTPETTLAFADQLRQYATHFAPRDWDYTREHNIRHIRMAGDHSGYDHPLRRVGRLVRRFLGPRDEIDTMLDSFAWKHPLITARAALRTDANLPDGVLDGGGIITHWEETGEYLQYVQPSVGAMLADWMEAEPDNPHALRIASEMKRINDRYGDRIEGDGAA